MPREIELAGNHIAPWFDGMRRQNYVCFHCRKTKKAAREAFCCACGKPMICMGERTEIPPRNDRKGWRRLREQVNARRDEQKREHV